MKQTKRSLSKLLTSQEQVVCLDPTSHIATLALGIELATKGKTVAKIIKGY